MAYSKGGNTYSGLVPSGVLGVMSPFPGGRGYKHSCPREAMVLDGNELHTGVSCSPLQSPDVWDLTPDWPGHLELSKLPKGLCREGRGSTAGTEWLVHPKCLKPFSAPQEQASTPLPPI